MIGVARIQAWSFRCPTPKPVATSFGIMCDRPAVLVRIEDHDGAFGWGEIWANWPAAGAEHRARLLEMDIAPLLVGTRAQRPEDFFHRLEQQTQIRATQCGEIGPFNQVIAGLDIALWTWRRAVQDCPCGALSTAPPQIRCLLMPAAFKSQKPQKFCRAPGQKGIRPSN